MVIFPIDDETLNYMRLTNRDEEHIQVTEAYTKPIIFSMIQSKEPSILRLLKFDLSSIKPSISGPKRPRFWFFLSDAKQEFLKMQWYEKQVSVALVWIRKS